MALTRIQPPAIADVREPNFRNIVINGDMQIAQRATSATGLTNGSNGYHTCDRWKFSEGGAPSFQFTQTQSTDVPTGQGFATSLKMDCTTAQGSLAAADNLRIDQRIEGQNLQYLAKGTSDAKSTTLSFWVYATKTGTNIVELLDNDNTRSISKSYTVDTTNTWEKKTITFAGDTTGAFGNDNAQSLRCSFFLAAGTDLTSGTLQTSWATQVTANRAVGQVNHADSTSNDWYVTGIQLEAGSVATDFEVISYPQNLERCQRYYYLFCNTNNKEIGSGGYYNASQIFVSVPMIETMRSAPSLDFTSGTDYYIAFRAGGNDAFNSFTLGQADINMVSLYNASEVSGTSGDAAFFRLNDASASIAFAAEL